MTVKVVKKKQKKGPSAGRFITKTVPNESFFNFFDAEPKVMSDEQEVGLSLYPFIPIWRLD